PPRTALITLLPFSFLSSSRPHPDLHSFPTRRSSDLPVALNLPHGLPPCAPCDPASVLNIDRAALHNASASAATASTLMLGGVVGDRKSTRLNSSHVSISYAVFCLKKKKKKTKNDIAN